MKKTAINRKTARAVVLHAGAVLLMERWRTDSGAKKLHYFSIPGGQIEPGETPERAVVREIFEEMKILIRPSKTLLKSKVGNQQHTYILCEYLSGEPKLASESPEAKLQTADNRYEPCWVSEHDFKKVELHKIYEPARDIIEKLLTGELTNR